MIIKPFMNQQQLSCISIHSDNYHDAVFEVIDPDNFPEELGGNCLCEGGCFRADTGVWKDHLNDIEDPYGKEMVKNLEELQYNEYDSDSDEALPISKSYFTEMSGSKKLFEQKKK